MQLIGAKRNENVNIYMLHFEQNQHLKINDKEHLHLAINENYMNT